MALERKIKYLKTNLQSWGENWRLFSEAGAVLYFQNRLKLQLSEGMFVKNKHGIWSSYPIVLAALSHVFEQITQRMPADSHIRMPRFQKVRYPVVLTSPEVWTKLLLIQSVLHLKLPTCQQICAVHFCLWLIKHILSPFYSL